MLAINCTNFELTFHVGDKNILLGDLTITTLWSEHASDVEDNEEHEVLWRVNFHGLTMRIGGRILTGTLRECVIEAIRRHLEPSEGRWSHLTIEGGEVGEVNEYDIIVKYETRMYPSHLETIRSLMDGISATLGGILESSGVIPADS